MKNKVRFDDRIKRLFAKKKFEEKMILKKAK